MRGCDDGSKAGEEGGAKTNTILPSPDNKAAHKAFPFPNVFVLKCNNMDNYIDFWPCVIAYCIWFGLQKDKAASIQYKPIY